jgi:hypothetical protein
LYVDHYDHNNFDDQLQFIEFIVKFIIVIIQFKL